MAEKGYVALVDFNVNIDNGKETVKIPAGAEFTYDGLYVTFGDAKGMCKPLGKMAGEWFVGSNKPAPAPKPAAPNPNTSTTRVENSDEVPSAPVVNAGKDRELEGMVDNYEKGTYKTPSAKVIHDDETVVSQVKNTDQNAVKNTTGVQVDEQPETEKRVVYEEERVAKEMVPQKQDEGEKHLAVEDDGDGVLVKETSPLSEVERLRKQLAEAEAKLAASQKPQVSKEEEAVKQTSAPNNESKDIGSSTQAQTVERPATPKGKISGKKVGTLTRSKQSGRQVVLDEQDGTVVGKVKNTNINQTKDGISIRTRVKSADDVEEAQVTYGNSVPNEPEVQITGSEPSAVDASDAGIPVQKDADIDVEDLLNEI